MQVCNGEVVGLDRRRVEGYRGDAEGHSYHHLAWPVGRPFNDWWNTMGHYSKAVADNALPDGIDDRIVEGLIGALERQSAYFKKLHH